MRILNFYEDLIYSSETMNKIIVIGHKNPDSDSVISAIAAEEFFSNALGMDAEAFRAGELNNETKFILQELGVPLPKFLEKIETEDSVALVDHNEISQAVDCLHYANVDYIFDHHKLNITSEKPIFCRMEPIGSTSSLFAKMFFERNIELSEVTAKLLLAGILSDTLNLLSPTTTEEDKELVSKLNEIAKINIPEFVAKMFKAKSSLEGISVEDIITLDYKPFEMGTCNVGVGTWETTNPDSVNEKKDEIIAALKVKKETDKLDYMFFMVVDIIMQNCQLYLIDEKEKMLAEKVFSGNISGNTMLLPGVVSRKKQIVPQLTEELNK